VCEFKYLDVGVLFVRRGMDYLNLTYMIYIDSNIINLSIITFLRLVCVTEEGIFVWWKMKFNASFDLRSVKRIWACLLRLLHARL